MEYIMQPQDYHDEDEEVKTRPSTADTSICPDSLEQLGIQLERLLTQHQYVLDNEFAREEVECLLRWVDQCQNGGADSRSLLFEQGKRLLEDVKHRLDLALAEQQRIIEESPANAHFTHGREAERYARAERHAEKALCTLCEVVEQSSGEENPQSLNVTPFSSERNSK